MYLQVYLNLDLIQNLLQYNHLLDVIYSCVNIKREIVEMDEFDRGERLLLNFGHTLGHAIEQYHEYKKESHGEAVAIGMYQLTKIAEEKELTKSGQADRIKKVLEAYGLPVCSEIPLYELTEAMKLDKKTLNNQLKIILLSEIGEAYVYPTDMSFFEEKRTI